LELCARFRVLLADADSIYDPADHNDRLLLALKSGATYPTVIPHSRHPRRYPRGSSS
jgi:hypothetical protein